MSIVWLGTLKNRRLVNTKHIYDIVKTKHCMSNVDKYGVLSHPKIFNFGLRIENTKQNNIFV
jgi:hypothetical protein